MESISEGIYFQNAYAGVTLGAIILQHGTLLIDTPLKSEDARSWKSIVLTQSKGMHRLLVNLDQHIDRTIGNRYMDMTILSHKVSSSAFANRSAVFKGQTLISGAEWEKHPEILGSRWTPPNITFSDHLNLNWGDEKIHLKHRPGPAPGAIWVEIPSRKILFIGDAVTDQPPFFAIASIPHWLKSIKKLTSSKYKNYTIISGRSGPITLKDIHNQISFLQLTQEQLKALPHKGYDPDQIEDMLPVFLKKFSFPPKRQHNYEDRLRHGLREYFQNHYLLAESPEK